MKRKYLVVFFVLFCTCSMNAENTTEAKQEAPEKDYDDDMDDRTDPIIGAPESRY